MKKNTSEKIVNLLMIALIVGTVTFSGITLAKFVSQDNTKTPIQPAYFHFNCSRAENETYVLNVKEGEITTSTSFSVNNYVFDVASYENINYKVTLVDDETSISSVIKEDVLQGQVLSEDLIEVNGLSEGKTYTVIVTSDSPYIREYSFKYYVANKTLETYYTIKDHGTWIQLDLYIGGSAPSEDITIVYGDKLAPNPTLDIMQEWEMSNQHTINKEDLEINTHYTYQFVELTSGEYSIEEKTAIINNKIIF